MRSKALEVTVTGRYALSEAAQAHSDLEARRTTGRRTRCGRSWTPRGDAELIAGDEVGDLGD
ncbi:hypothetical protein ACFU5Y_19425 [Streptomyces gardneri]|uniref:hypothetical protein n=1 Tax=Streptomyces gardneri TaxID=66892 RepID=UPI0036B913BF